MLFSQLSSIPLPPPPPPPPPHTHTHTAPGFMGYASEIHSLVTHHEVKDTDDDQLYYTKLYLDRENRVRQFVSGTSVPPHTLTPSHRSSGPCGWTIVPTSSRT